MLDCTPVAAEQRVRADEVDRAGDPAVVAAGHHQQHVLSHGERHRDDKREPGRCTLLVFELAAPNQGIAARNLEFAGDGSLRFVYEANQVASAYVAQNGREALPILPDHLDGTVLDANVRDLRQLHGPSARQHDRHAREVGCRGPLPFLAANHQRRANLSLQDDAEIASIHPDANRLLHLFNV